jgi:hypothetical protein
MISGMLVSCTEANAVAIDATDDVHCSVLAFKFKAHADSSSAPADQRHALKVVHEWYAAKVRAVAVERWGDKQGFEREMQPLLDLANQNPAAVTDDLKMCVDRALADPAFNSFAGARSR